MMISIVKGRKETENVGNGKFGSVVVKLVIDALVSRTRDLKCIEK